MFGTGEWGDIEWGQTDAAVALEDYPDTPPWEWPEDQIDPETGYPTVTIPGVTSGGVPTATEVILEPERGVHYIIEVWERGRHGARMGVVTKWFGGAWKRERNKASTLTFSVVYDNTMRQYLTPIYEVRLLDAFGRRLDTFTPEQPRPRQHGGERYCDFRCVSRLEQLKNDVVINYTTVREVDGVEVFTKTISAILSELFDQFQVTTPAIRLGDIHESIGSLERCLEMPRGNILEAINQLLSSVPKDTRGYLWVDTTDTLRWDLTYGANTPIAITAGTNLIDINVEPRYDQLYNRVHLFGNGMDPATQVALPAPGYVEDAASVATYGVRALVKQDRRIIHQATLTAMANRILEEFKDPRYEYKVQVADLAKSESRRFQRWGELTLASNTRLVAQQIGVDASVEIVSIENRLDNVLSVSIELNNAASSLDALLGHILDQLNAPWSLDREPIVRIDPDAVNPRDGDVRYDEATGALEYWNDDHWEELQNAADGGGAPGAGVEPYASPPEPVGAIGTADPGDVATYSRGNHIHERYQYGARMFKGATVATTPDDADEARGFGDFISTQEGTYGRLKWLDKAGTVRDVTWVTAGGV